MFDDSTIGTTIRNERPVFPDCSVIAHVKISLTPYLYIYIYTEGAEITFTYGRGVRMKVIWPFWKMVGPYPDESYLVSREGVRGTSKLSFVIQLLRNQ